MAGGPSTPALVAPVTEAGGLGSYGAAYLPVEKLRQAIREIRAITSRPFAVNLFADDGVAPEPAVLDAARKQVAKNRAEPGLPPAPTETPQAPLRQAFPALAEKRGPGFSFTSGLPP